MCWTGNSVEAKGKIASKDVFVYKVLHQVYNDLNKTDVKCLVSPYQHMEYKIGERHTTTSIIEPEYVEYAPNYSHIINGGLHCYSENCIFNKSSFDTDISKPDGGHLTCYRGGRLIDIVLVKCKIPQGTTYYENNKGEIVTEKLEVLYEVDVPIYRIHGKNMVKSNKRHKKIIY